MSLQKTNTPSHHTHSSSIDPLELDHFATLSAQWWDESGPLRALHAMNPTRLKFILQSIYEHFNRKMPTGQPLKGLSVLDVGCGGGLLCEPLARLGAQVTGLDPCAENCDIARSHASANKLDIRYLAQEVETLQDNFDIVLAMEVVEHVANLTDFIKACCARLKPTGIIFFSTLNRTLKSYMLGIIAAEYVLRWAPRGTHDWQKFVTPNELQRALTMNHIDIIDRQGMRYNIGKKSWEACADLSVNYMVCGTFPTV